ncbi:MAG: hypothetical protein Q9162_005278 [Coniocarpon cinnabarinum]
MTMTITSYEEPVEVGASTTGLDHQPREDLRQRRRNSSYHTEPWLADYENIQLLIEDFLAGLERRLDFLESYGHLRIDNGLERAYNTLHAVRQSCSQASDNVLGTGRRKAKIFIDTLEARYNALAQKETMEQKVQEGVRMLDSFLTDLESRAYALRDAHASAASHLIDESWRRVDSGIERAREVVDEKLEKARRAKEALKHKIEAAVSRAKERGLIHFDDLPAPWRTNPHILRGYRFSETKAECFRSIASLSNEFVNIWSHLIGLIIVVAIASYFYPSSMTFSSSSTADILVALMFFGAAVQCLACSALWHTMSSISNESTLQRFACVDYTGISLLVATSIMTTEYTAFYCEPISRYTYMTSTFLLGIGGMILAWQPNFNRPDMAWKRVGFYIALGATSIVPVMQIMYERGFTWMIYFYSPILKSIAVYIGGAVLYASKVPERWCPGMFDYVGGSHNIWHVAVLGGILFHYTAMHEFFHKAFVRKGIDGCGVY